MLVLKDRASHSIQMGTFLSPSGTVIFRLGTELSWGFTYPSPGISTLIQPKTYRTTMGLLSVYTMTAVFPQTTHSWA